MINMLDKIRSRYPIQYINVWIYNKLTGNKNHSDTITIYDTSMDSDNLGDQIINFYCNNIFEDMSLNVEKRIPTHRKPTKPERRLLLPSSLKIITGTNILSSEMNLLGLWQRSLNPSHLAHLCLMGTGWNAYSEKENRFTKLFYKTYLDNQVFHSVRDSYTENKLRSMGIENVINTACPTMWRLTESFCQSIPKTKADFVVTTITDYHQNKEFDWYMLDTLIKLYKKVYVWIQGRNDLEYLRTYPQFDKLECINNTLISYNEILKKDSIDFVGTRLHAGIHALNHRKRSIIISIDNRAKEVAKDTNLPVLERTEVKEKLESYILQEWETQIRIPEDNISIWKQQFEGK
ncbi:polysaccharide pyruvyl transferase family protein [Bacillus sp. X1(2014)]|uniref:polysaccharide pyruvyl transferase family protein n=1 Tax=Bacillus sp. X1(2014) TaxID=1565991 RepID=UPI0011A4F03A|nr:polysaccharide pyruvyl transferase family protein [Bacillus sp. X1(2014)]